ncbi:MAG: biopolymer transporter ExbD [Hyphomonadaceae bacterium]|nr:biopolymer transporter ExbD [Hyphomonadaceae bacterium]
MAMQIGPQREGEPNSEINTTPLIDVMLVLLIMLIVTLPAQNHATKLDTPAPCTVDCPLPGTPLQPILIRIDFDGSLLWNGLPLAVSDLDRRFNVEAHREEQPEVHIAPHRLAHYGEVAHVMAVAQREGLKKLGVVGGT